LNTKTNYLKYIDVAFTQLYCVIFSFKSVDSDSSNCYARKQKEDDFFMKHSVGSQLGFDVVC